MKYFLTLICVSAILTSCKIQNHLQLSEKSNFDLYLLIGQSNMAGRGIIEMEDTTVHIQVYVLNAADSFVLAREPLHYDKKNRGTGPGLEFGKTMAGFYPKTRIGLIPAAVGGTKISYWTPGHKRGLYEQAVRKTKEAMKHGNLKGILWQQGESDSNSRDAPLYKERLIKLLKQFRQEFGSNDIPIVLGELGSFLRSSHYKDINKSLLEISQELPNVSISKASEQGHIGDNLHFNSSAQRENGRNMAYEMYYLIK